MGSEEKICENASEKDDDAKEEIESESKVYKELFAEIKELGHFPKSENPLYHKLYRAKKSGRLSSDEWKRLRDVSSEENP